MTKKELKEKVRKQELEIAKLQGKIEGLNQQLPTPWYDHRIWFNEPRWIPYTEWRDSTWISSTGVAPTITTTTTRDTCEVESMNL